MQFQRYFYYCTFCKNLIGFNEEIARKHNCKGYVTYGRRLEDKGIIVVGGQK